MYNMAALLPHPMVTWIPVYIVKCVDITITFFGDSQCYIIDFLCRRNIVFYVQYLNRCGLFS